MPTAQAANPKHLFLILFALVLLTTACTPVGRARANRIQAETQRADDLHRLNMERKEALQPVRIEAGFWLIWAATITTIALLAAFAVAGSWWLIGESRARVKAAVFRATLIPLDPATRQFPLLPYEVQGVLQVYDPNTRTLHRLDRPAEPHPQLADGAISIRLAGAAAEPPKLLR